jgi:hypothetical protein
LGESLVRLNHCFRFNCVEPRHVIAGQGILGAANLVAGPKVSLEAQRDWHRHHPQLAGVAQHLRIESLEEKSRILG